MNGLQFDPNMTSLNDLAGIYGSGLGGMKQRIMDQLPMGMINRDGQQFMGQQQPQMQAPQQGMRQGDMMKLAGMAMQGFNRGQQAPQAPTQQIIRDSNQFRFAGTPQQQMAQALRRA
jgi:hypothetical protein